MKIIILLLLVLALSALACADVGVVVEFPNGTIHSKCADASDGRSAYDILERTDLDIDWSGDGTYGRALCMINGVGDPVSGDACAWGSDYWGFYLSLNGTSWDYSPVGFTAGGCWNRDSESFDGHYCAQDGDTIGLAYGGYGTKPKSMDFEDVCMEDSQEVKKPKKVILRSSRPFWESYCNSFGIKFDATLPPQNLRKLGEEKKAEYYAREFSISANQTNATVPIEVNIPIEAANKTITYDYEPKVITDLSKPLKLSFNSDGFPFSGLPLSVNGQSYTTDGNGSVFLNIERGDYLVKASYAGFKELNIIFRIGG